MKNSCYITEKKCPLIFLFCLHNILYSKQEQLEHWSIPNYIQMLTITLKSWTSPSTSSKGIYKKITAIVLETNDFIFKWIFLLMHVYLEKVLVGDVLLRLWVYQVSPSHQILYALSWLYVDQRLGGWPLGRHSTLWTGYTVDPQLFWINALKGKNNTWKWTIKP